MVKKARVKRFEKVIRSVDPMLWTTLISLLVKIIGESVKDKVVRAILIGALGAFGSYATSVEEAPVPDPPVQGLPSQSVQQLNKPPL